MNPYGGGASSPYYPYNSREEYEYCRLRSMQPPQLGIGSLPYYQKETVRYVNTTPCPSLEPIKDTSDEEPTRTNKLKLLLL